MSILWVQQCLDRFWAWLGRGLHQLGQPSQVVGSGSQIEHPADAGEAAVTGLTKAGGTLDPAKHLLSAAHASIKVPSTKNDRPTTAP